MEAQQTPLRTAIMRLMSDLLDSADDYGIYETGRFMDRIEQLLCDMMATPEVMRLSGSEAVMGFMAWLTTRDEITFFGPHEPVDITLYERFVEANHLTEPREMYAELLTHPSEPEVETETEPCPENGDAIGSGGGDRCSDDSAPVREAMLLDSSGKVIARGSLEEVLEAYSLRASHRKK